MINNKKFFELAVKFEFSSKVRHRFYLKLAQLLENGVLLDTALMQIQSYQNKTKGSIMPSLYARWRRNVANGQNFGRVMSPYIPSTESILLETGADTGYLVDALYNAAETVEQQGKVKTAIISNAAYPVLLIAMLFAALILSSYQVIPIFEEILPRDQWQGPAVAVAIVSQAIRDYGIIFLTIFVAIIVMVSISLSRWISRSRLLVEDIVPWNLYRMWQGSSFLLSIAALMSAGIKLDEVSLRRLSKNADPYLLQRVKAIKKWIMSGASLGDALYKAGYKFPDEEIIADLRVYANLKGFDKNLIRISKTWVNDLVDKVAATMRVFNTFVLVLIAIVIGFLISSLYGIVQQIQAAA